MTQLGQQIGARIARWRRRQRLTQDGLGALLSQPVDGNTISRWERGTREPSFGRLEQLAVALNTTPDTLLSGITAERVNNDFQDLQAILEQRPVSDLRSVLRVVEAHLMGLDDVRR